MEFIKKIKLKHIGFVLSIVFILISWIMRFLVSFVIEDNSLISSIEHIQSYVAGVGVFFLFGGIIFFAVMSAKEQENTPPETLTKDQEEEKSKLKLQDDAAVIKSSIPITMMYGFLSILMTLGGVGIIINNDRSRSFGISTLILGLLLSQYYIRKNVRQFKWLRFYKNMHKSLPQTSNDYTINYGKNLTVILRILDDYSILAIFDDFPISDKGESEFLKEFSDFVGVTVFRDDRECLAIMSTDETTVKKAITFLESKSKAWS